MRYKLSILLIVCTIVFIIAGCNGQESDDESTEETITPVETAEVDTGNFNVEKSMYGRTAPLMQSPVMLEQPGEIKTLKVENGDTVEKDDHIATIKTPMGNKTIYAQTDGEIARLDAREGNFQSNEEPLLVIVDLDKITAEFPVTSSVRDLFKKDDKVIIKNETDEYEGKVLALDTLPDEAGQFSVKVEVNNDDGTILPGSVVKMALKQQKVKDTIIIPTEAVVTESDDTYIFMVDGDHAKKISVEVQATQSEKTAIKADVTKGDQIIIKGQYTLVDGGLIEVKEGNAQ